MAFESLHIRSEAKEMIDRYFEVHPGVRTYLDDVVAQAHKDGYATTLFGRRRYIPELKAQECRPAWFWRAYGDEPSMQRVPPLTLSSLPCVRCKMSL